MKNNKLILWYYWYIKPIKYWPNNVIQGISNLIYYFGVIWKQRDFDHGYIEDLLLKKFKRQYNHYLSEKCMQYIDIEKDIQSLKICIDILERRRSDWYCSSWFDHPQRDTENLEERQLILKTIENRDWSIFCKILDKYFNSWWD